MVNNSESYEVLGLLGVGAAGAVYRARRARVNGPPRDVALKVLNTRIDDARDLPDRLQDRVRKLSMVQYGAIVQVEGLTQIDGRWAVVMEYLDGVDLQNLLQRGRLPIRPALEIVAEVSEALHAVYTQVGPEGQAIRLIHQGIKPSSIMVTRDARVKVLDFGLNGADLFTSTTNTPAMVCDTSEYRAPEQLNDQLGGPEADVYVLAAVLFELLTGKKLGLSSANSAWHGARLERACEILTQEGDTPEPVAALLWEALAYEPSARPSAGELARRLREASRGVKGPSLRSWATDVLPRLIAARELQTRTISQIDAATVCITPDQSQLPTSLYQAFDGIFEDDPSELKSESNISLVNSSDLGEPVPELAPARPGGGRLVLVATAALFGLLGAVAALRHFVERGDSTGAPELEDAARGGDAYGPVIGAVASPPPEPSSDADDPGSMIATSAALIEDPPKPAPPRRPQTTSGQRDPVRPPEIQAPPQDVSVTQPASQASGVSVPGRVTFRGDAASVELTQAGPWQVTREKLSSGDSIEVAPGAYLYIAQFDHLDLSLRDCIRVEEGSSVVLECSATLRSCEASGASSCI